MANQVFTPIDRMQQLTSLRLSIEGSHCLWQCVYSYWTEVETCPAGVSSLMQPGSNFCSLPWTVSLSLFWGQTHAQGFLYSARDDYNLKAPMPNEGNKEMSWLSLLSIVSFWRYHAYHLSLIMHSFGSLLSCIRAVIHLPLIPAGMTPLLPWPLSSPSCDLPGGGYRWVDTAALLAPLHNISGSL